MNINSKNIKCWVIVSDYPKDSYESYLIQTEYGWINKASMNKDSDYIMVPPISLKIYVEVPNELCINLEETLKKYHYVTVDTTSGELTSLERKKNLVYLSGPITSDKEGYKEHFANAAKFLEKLGYEVTNPSKDEYDEEVKEKGHTDKWTKEAWLEYIHDDINMVVSHDYICLLLGWEDSSGALLEIGTAKRFGLKLIMEDPTKKEGFTVYDDWSIVPSLILKGTLKNNE